MISGIAGMLIIAAFATLDIWLIVLAGEREGLW